MRFNHLFLLFLIIAPALDVTGQSYEFRVLAVKGNNAFKNQEQLKTGMSLQAGDTLFVKDPKPYIGLMHKTGRTLEIRKSGSYPISRLSNDKEYFDYIWNDNVTYGNEDGPDVPRFEEPTAIRPWAVRNNYVLNMPLLLRWDDLDSLGSYEIKVENIFDEVIHTRKVDDYRMIIQAKDIQNQTGLALMTIASDSVVANRFSFILTEMSEEVGDLWKKAKDSDKPDDWIALAETLEENEFNYHAYYTYYQAFMLSKQSTKYNKKLKEFESRYQRLIDQ